MADDSNYNTKFKRRQEQKTDYKQRLGLLKSDKPRAVIRTSNQHTRAHLSHYSEEGDTNTAQTISKELEEYGWEHATGNLPAAYLTGYLTAKKTEEPDAILDIGLRTPKNGGRVFAALKGMIDAGLQIPAGEEVFPTQERIEGQHIKEMTDKNVPENFQTVKENIQGEFE